jgi:tRNA threonylcarbamoyladenosine biosynthesis protein TsaB
VIVLGFDTATPATAVGLRLADGSTLRAREDPAAGERPGHTTRLLALAWQLLAEAQLGWSAVELIAVGVGPGTFTGLRIGVATARGLAQSLDVAIVGVSTPRVLAEAALREPSPPARVLAAIDARRGEAFVAAYAAAGSGKSVALAESAEPGASVAPGGPAEVGPAPGEPRAQELAAPRALAPRDFDTALAEAGADHAWQAVGDGAIRYRAELQALGVAVAPDTSGLHRVDAGVLCELGLHAARRGGSESAPETVLPDYRRRPDAELALERAPRVLESSQR